MLAWVYYPSSGDCREAENWNCSAPSDWGKHSHLLPGPNHSANVVGGIERSPTPPGKNMILSLRRTKTLGPPTLILFAEKAVRLCQS